MSTFRNYVGGEWIAAVQSVENINPSDTTDVIGEFGQADSYQVTQAIEAADSAFREWSVSGIQQRFDALDFIGTELLARKEELGTLLAREEGKTRAEGIGEAARAGQIFKFFAGEVLRLAGDVIPSVRPGISIEVTREPIGVIGVITPWNFPIAIPAWKIAPAIAYGNCVVFKPASLVPASAWALTEIISRSGLPGGVFNLVMGGGSEVGGQMTKSKQVQGVSFTGSQETGSSIAAECSRRGAKFQLEMGGKNPLVILNDADLKLAVDCAINSAFYSTGQRCTAASRLIVESGVYDEFIALMKQSMDKLQVGNALEDGVHIGPVVDQSQLNQNFKYIDIGKSEGATLLCGGERLERPAEGFYMSPALFVDTDVQMRINQEEIFGPIASVIKVDDRQHALEAANETRFGLSAGICTTSLKAANEFKRRSQAGMVMVNLPTAGVDYHVPFGGTKESSYGPREQGSYAAEFYTKVKTAYTLP